MIANKKQFKDLITIVKKILKDKTASRLFIQKEGDKIKIQAVTQQLVIFNFMDNLEVEPTEDKAFVVNPYELESLLKGKTKEIEFKINVDSLEANDVKIPIKQMSLREMKPLNGMKFFEDENLFLQILNEAETVLHESDKESTKYLKLQAVNALAADPIRIHYYRLSEQFEIEEAHIHMDVVKILSKHLTQGLKHGVFKMGEKKAMVISQNDSLFFVINADKKASFPNLKKMTRNTEKIGTIIVNVDELNEKASKYKKAVKEISFEIKDNMLIADPRNEEAEVIETYVQSTEGVLPKVLFNSEAVKGMFSAYTGLVRIEHFDFLNIFGEKAYLWRITSPDKITMIAGIEEPNWDEIKIGNN